MHLNTFCNLTLADFQIDYTHIHTNCICSRLGLVLLNRLTIRLYMYKCVCVHMAKGRNNISIDEDLALRMKIFAQKKYRNSKSFSTLIEDLFKKMENELDADIEEFEPDNIEPAITNKEVTELAVPEDKAQKMTKNEARAELGLTQLDIGEDEQEKPHQSSMGESCDPWRGPWICTHCNGFWTTMRIHHAPVACPGCGKKDGITRLTRTNWKPS